MTEVDVDTPCVCDAGDACLYHSGMALEMVREIRRLREENKRLKLPLPIMIEQMRDRYEDENTKLRKVVEAARELIVAERQTLKRGRATAELIMLEKALCELDEERSHDRTNDR